MTPITATSFLGPRTAENESAHDDINFLLADIRNLSTPLAIGRDPDLVVEQFYLYQAIGKIFDTLPFLSGWRVRAGGKCEKVYEIDGRYYTCQAGLSRDGDIWSAELFWPDQYGLQPCVPGASLLIASQRIENQIEKLRPSGHGRVDCEGVDV